MDYLHKERGKKKENLFLYRRSCNTFLIATSSSVSWILAKKTTPKLPSPYKKKKMMSDARVWRGGGEENAYRDFDLLVRERVHHVRLR